MISGEPKINGVNGYDMIETPYAAYLHVKQVCEKNDELSFDKLDGGKLDPIMCDIKIPTIPVPMSVTKIPELPEL